MSQDKINELEIANDSGLDLRVSRIDYGIKSVENFIEIRARGGYYITIPEKRFRQVCEWYFKNHVEED
jgi:hypothetical protein